MTLKYLCRQKSCQNYYSEKLMSTS